MSYPIVKRVPSTGKVILLLGVLETVAPVGVAFCDMTEPINIYYERQLDNRQYIPRTVPVQHSERA